MLMKTINNIFKSLALSAAIISVAACEPQLGNQDDPSVTPHFPELIENYAVEPGSVQEIVFTPNLDWKITIPSEVRQWFWIVEGSFKVAELSGEASDQPVKVLIGVTDNPEFDKNFSCDVTLHMRDSSQVVAKFMLPAKEKSIEVFAAKALPEGGFELADDGVSYNYSGDVASSLDLIWSPSDSDFRLPVRVLSNCEWTVNHPEWVEVNVPEKTTGVIDLIFKGESILGDSGKITFYAGEAEVLSLDMTIPSCGGVEVLPAKFDGAQYEYDEEGQYLWSDSAVEEVSLAWLGSDFRLPVKISSRCNWTVITPEWVSVELPEKTAGDVVLTLIGVPSKYPLADTSSKMIFKIGEEVVDEVVINIPGCNDILKFSLDRSLTSLEYNYLAELRTSTGFVTEKATAQLMSSQAVRVLVVETTGNKVASAAPDWFGFELSNWNTASDAAVLQERTLTFEVTENDGPARTAVLFVLPPSITQEAAELFTDNAVVKEEYEEYAVSVFQESKNYAEYIRLSLSEDSEYECSLARADQEKQAELSALLGETEFVYVLSYESPYCRDYASLNMAVGYSTFKVFSQDDLSSDKSSSDDFWLQFASEGDSKSYGVVDMYLNQDVPVEQSVGYIVFYDAEGGVLAIVECLSPSVPEILTVDSTELIFGAEAAEQTVNVTSNVDWTAESNRSWCVVSPEEGSKDGVVKVSVEENETGKDRSAKVKICSNNEVQTVEVTQKAGEMLEVSVDQVEFGCLASTKTITVRANVPWTIESDSDWCSVDPASGDKSVKVTVAVSRNFEDAERNAVLTLKSAGKTVTVDVSQMYDDGTITNGDETVHFKDYAEAKAVGAVLERLTTGDIYKQYRDGQALVYHLTYIQEGAPLRIVLPAEVKTHNVNPYANRYDIRVNDTLYEEFFGPNGLVGEVVLDSDNSVEIIMELPEGQDFLRGNINFMSEASETPVVILVCTIDITANK